jgi:NADH dehydrogenase
MNILILGAGYSGLRAALDLDQLLKGRGRGDQVTLVDRHQYHQLVQVLHVTATAGHDDREAIYALSGLLRETRVSFLQGDAAAIEPLRREVRLGDGRALPYDRLLIALGAETAYGAVPGAREHTLSLRSYEGALRIRDHLRASFAAAATTADPSQRRLLLTTAIVGGGYTGCQFAGELAHWADDLCAETGAPRGEVRIALLDSGPLLLAQFGAWATREAERVLGAMGVSVHLKTSVEGVEPDLLRVGGGRVLRAGTIVWAGGIRAPELLGASGLPVDSAGRALVDRYLRVCDQALIFAAGDCASIPDGPRGFVPATASYATRQGAHLAETLFAELEGRPPRPYEPLKLGELVSLGPHYAVGNPLGVPVFGLPAVLLKKGVERYYRATLEAPSAG